MNRRQMLAGLSAVAVAPSPVAAPVGRSAVGMCGASIKDTMTITLSLGDAEAIVSEAIDRACVAKIARGFVQRQMDRDDLFEPLPEEEIAA